MPQSMIVDQFEGRENRLLARLAKRAAVLADRASGAYPFTPAVAYAGGLPAASTYAMASGYGSGALGGYPFATAAADGGAVPTITLGTAYAGGLSATTTFTLVRTLVSQALTACMVSAKVLAGEAPANLAAGDYMSALAQATSWLLDFQRSVQQLQ
jgi:hypothetical protein